MIESTCRRGAGLDGFSQYRAVRRYLDARTTAAPQVIALAASA